MDCDKCVKNLAVFAGGVLFGSAGLKLLSSRDAKLLCKRTLPTYWPRPRTSTPSGRSRKLWTPRKPDPYTQDRGLRPPVFCPWRLQ